ncbi:MAG: amidohydrolase family protein [Planctomycetota bacterium]
MNSRVLHLAAAVLTPTGQTFRPGAVLAEGGRATAWGEADAMRREYAGDAAEITAVDHGEVLLMPGLVNAHAHLELTAIGPQPYGGDFLDWVRLLREHWPGDGDPWAKQPDEKWFAQAAQRGATASQQTGVEHVGDITRSDAVIQAQRNIGLTGVGFRELFGLGQPWDEPALEALNHGRSMSGVGWQPHAPYSAGRAVYEACSAAGQAGVAVCTHLAETHDEARFVSRGDGPFRDLLEGIGKWDDAFAAQYGQGLSPVRWMEPYLRATPWLVAHCNYVDDDDLTLLAETHTSVAYCPIASAYFLHEGHRYREMLDAGINVCLGTDSIVCQPPEEKQPLGTLPQMRFLYRRDGTDPDTLYRMATVNGRRALRLDDEVHTLLAVPIDPDDAIKPLVQALRSDASSRGVAL